MLNNMSAALAAVCLSIMGALPLRAQFTVKDYREFSVTENGKLLVKTYVKGLGEGMMIANLEAKKKKGTLYCAPQNLAVTPDNYLNILERQIKDIGVTMPAAKVDDLPLSILLMRGLQQTFPCQTAK
jgi:hypothetical protein